MLPISSWPAPRPAPSSAGRPPSTSPTSAENRQEAHDRRPAVRHDQADMRDGRRSPRRRSPSRDRMMRPRHGSPGEQGRTGRRQASGRLCTSAGWSPSRERIRGKAQLQHQRPVAASRSRLRSSAAGPSDDQSSSQRRRTGAPASRLKRPRWRRGPLSMETGSVGARCRRRCFAWRTSRLQRLTARSSFGTWFGT
jgi:hypothetical protein